MRGDALARARRRSDTLIAWAVLILLIAGWTEGFGASKLASLWALSSSFISGRHA
jgi:hypothetical protein